jgi:hypothetical protein
MKQSRILLPLLLMTGLIYYSFYSLMPQAGDSESLSVTEFSTARALVPLKVIAQAPHYFGSPEHEKVGDFLESELKNLGFETQVQEGYVLNTTAKNLDKPKNIIGRLKGSGSGKALVLLSHYDSALVPSFGASDAGSGIVTILESLRAYLASDKTPVNDIIVVFSDCEEIGLDGAKLFVNEHPWAKNVGLALNFEARGSGGPSNMILETNEGNSKLIKAFIEAKPEYPVASSLMYSIYKMLPNDTDSTIFREDGDIDSFFFAFIDDHFDYHTANDTVENLDLNSLQHQGSYLLPLLNYFAEADLSALKAKEDNVYVNLPLVKMVTYPFSWILPMLIIAIVLLIVLIFFGIKIKKIKTSEIARSFIPLLGSLVLCTAIGYFGWELLLKIYPQYEEVQQGFKYNGHLYIAFFVLLSLSILFRVYNKYSNRIMVSNLFIAVLILWIIINGAVSVYLKGAAFLIIPVFFGLLTLWILIRQTSPNLLLMLLLAAPAIFIFAPLIQFFPVGLGSGSVFISCLFTVLLFGLLLPVFGFFRQTNFLSFVCLIGAIVFLFMAHLKSDFSESHQKPNSLVYYQDADSGKSVWATYDKILDEWTMGYLGESPEVASKYIENVSESKYGTAYTFASEAPYKDIPLFDAILKSDTIIGAYQEVEITLVPKRTVNQISLYTDKELTFHSLEFNGKSVPADSSGNVYSNRKGNGLLRFYVADKDSLRIKYSIEKDRDVSFTILEYSYDLLNNPLFTMSRRTSNMMPKPFVVTDAIVIKKTIVVDSISKNTQKDELFYE